jgi:hypothetical protein
VQSRFDELLRNDGVFRQIVDTLVKNQLKVVVIGGWIRDQFVRENSLRPRDIDLIVQGKSGRALAALLPPPAKQTVYGGFTFKGETLDIDVWSLEETFLFEKCQLAATFSNVLVVTDFNINVILFYPGQFWGNAQIEDGGCFDSLSSREIDFHFEWVPLPIVQAARLAHFATKTGFDLSAEARRFIRSVCRNESDRQQVLNNLNNFCPAEYRSGARDLITTVGAVQRTRFFSNCLGVFEGGGVRTAAFAGAYAAAHEAGIAFTKVSGTSGGAIAAAFIATGAAPAAIKRQLFSVDLGALARRLDASQGLGGRRGILRLIRHVTWGRPRRALTLELFGGFFSSIELGAWIEEALHALLKSRGNDIGSRAVEFADLPIPLYVIASDLGHDRPQEWSRDRTPKASVAFAVRSSCTIPFY